MNAGDFDDWILCTFFYGFAPQCIVSFKPILLNAYVRKGMMRGRMCNICCVRKRVKCEQDWGMDLNDWGVAFSNALLGVDLFRFYPLFQL